MEPTILTCELAVNVNATWDSYLGTTSFDWSKSSVLDTTLVTGGANPRNCRPRSGWIEVCNAAYGNTGWLGVAQIWVSGGHIAQGTVKVNDTYFDTAKYNTPAWRNLVMCQEVGHTLGLDHQDESFDNANLGTCMDYTNDPSTNQHPNKHDYDELEAIYSHLDNTTTVGASTGFLPDAVPSFAPANRVSQSIYRTDLGEGRTLVTYVVWAD